MIKKVKDHIFKLDRAVCVLGNLCIVVNMLVVVINILLRNFNMKSFSGITDYAGYISCIIVVLCIAYTEAQNGNPKIDFIVAYLPKLVQKIIFVVVSLLDLIVGVMLSYSFFKYAVTSAAAGTTSMNAKLPYAPFLIVSGIGMALFSLTIIAKLLDKMVKWEGGEV